MRPEIVSDAAQREWRVSRSHARVILDVKQTDAARPCCVVECRRPPVHSVQICRLLVPPRICNWEQDEVALRDTNRVAREEHNPKQEPAGVHEFILGTPAGFARANSQRQRVNSDGTSMPI